MVRSTSYLGLPTLECGAFVEDELELELELELKLELELSWNLNQLLN